MRLIDADSIRGFAKHIKTNEKFEQYIMIDDLSKLLDEQPTTYDIDKVVEELEIERKTANNTYNSFNMDVDLGRVFGLEKAIEIVKQGGVYEAEHKLKEMESD